MKIYVETCKCGSDDITRESVFLRNGKKWENLYWYGCNHCGCAGKTANNIADAKDNWNNKLKREEKYG